MTKLVQGWYALHTKSRFENIVREGLSKKSIEVFLPKMKVRSKRKDRVKTILVPLFPGYLFVRTNLDPREHLEIVKTIGAIRLIGTSEGPTRIPDETIESLKIMVTGENEVFTGPSFQPGDKIMVISGPFEGVTGKFVRHKGQKGRVMVYIGALGQFAAVEVDKDDIELLPAG